MRANLRKMALSGMQGRKKDTRVLTSVIAMSFLFLTVGTLLLSSLTESQARQRHSLYGSWQFFSKVGTDSDLQPALAELDFLEESHLVTVLGTDDQAGAVAVWDEKFAHLGGLQLAEGRAPEKSGEIVLEKGQLSLFKEEITVGSTVTISLSKEYEHLRGTIRPENLPETLTILGIEVEAEPFWRLSYDITGEGLENWLCDNWSQLRKATVGTRVEGTSFTEKQIFPEEIQNSNLPPREMDEPARRMLVEALAECFDGFNVWMSGLRLPTTYLGRNAWTYDTVDGIRWDLKTSYAVSIHNSSNVSDDYVYLYGAVNSQKVSLSQECTVVGILETTADRWDVGDAQVPNCYISQESAELFYETAKRLNRQEGKSHLFAPAQTVLNDGGLLFLRGGDSISEGFQQLKAASLNVLSQITEETFSINIWNELPEGCIPTQLDEVSAEEVEQIRQSLAQADALGDAVIEGVEYGDFGQDYQFYETRCSRQSAEDSYNAAVWFCRPAYQVTLSDGRELQKNAGVLYACYYDGQGQMQCEMVSLEDVVQNAWAPEGMQPVGYSLTTLEDAYTYNICNLRINRYGWPMEQGVAETMGSTVIGVIMVITVCAVFQIFFTQLRRRARKLTLLRSVGATNGQVFGILAWEGVAITVAALILGDVLGYGIAWFITGRLNDTVFYVDTTLFLTGQICGIIAVAAGMLLPSIRAIRAPLVGRMEGKKRRHVKVRPMKKQTWRRICARDRAGNPGRTAGTTALCVFLVAMELICVFLGNAAFDTYRETVIAADHPDFCLELNHAGSERKRLELEEMVNEAEGISRADFYRVGEHLFLWYDKMEESPVLTALQEIDASFFEASGQKNPRIPEEGLITRFYELDCLSDLFGRLQDSITEGSVNQLAYDEGEEVILMLPMYCEGSGSGEAVGETMREVLESSGAMSISFNANTADVWQKDTSIQVGDTITIGTDAVRVSEDGIAYTQQLKQVEVAAIVRYFPEQGIWPFSGDVQSHLIVGSRKLMASLYDAGFATITDDRMDNVEMYIQTFDPYGYGKAVYSLYSATDASVEQTLSPVTRIAREKHMILRNYKDANQAVYEKALSSCLLVGTLAFAATLIVWMILSNTLSSAQEQGRKRTGILQSLGVTRGQLIRSQAAQACGYWFVSTVIANVLLAAVILIAGWIERLGQPLSTLQLLQMILREDLMGYPWGLHGALCLMELPILLWFHLRAVKIPLKYSPVENIRS